MKVQQITEHPSAILFFLTGLFIFFIFRLLHFLTQKNWLLKRKKYIPRIIIFIEIITWFIYLTGGIDLFVYTKPVISIICGIILLFVVFWFIWFILRDFIAGLFLKFKTEFKPDEIIEFEGVSGKIIKIGNTVIELENATSGRIKIPYHQFYVKPFVHIGILTNYAKSNFSFKLNSNLNPVEALESINEFINQLPWTNSKFNHKILIEESIPGETIIRINAYLFDTKYLDKFQQLIKQRFE